MSVPAAATEAGHEAAWDLADDMKTHLEACRAAEGGISSKAVRLVMRVAADAAMAAAAPRLATERKCVQCGEPADETDSTVWHEGCLDVERTAVADLECEEHDKRIAELEAEAEARRAGQDLMHDDLAELLRALGMGDHARPQSPHEVMQEAIGEVRGRCRLISEVRAIAVEGGQAPGDVRRRIIAALDEAEGK